MHESALRIGELVIQTYCDLPTARILEIGSMDVNGSLRDLVEPTTQYVGVDLEEGPAVDVVVKPGEKLPFDDASFDFIMASSAFEHDPRFWDTFIEMCRVARPGGHVYVNAPSNGGVHRYPLDCWRFYPDAGLALMEYAREQQIKVDLVESFVGRRYTDSWDGWNDFAAIFRRGPSKTSLNNNFVYKRYPSYNARTWKSSNMDCETSLTEDMQLGRDLRQQVAEQTAKLDFLEKERVKAEKLGEKLTADLRISESETSHMRSAIASFEQQVGVLSSALQTQTDTLSAVRNDAREKFDQFEKERVEAEDLREKLTAALRTSESETSHMRSAIASLEQQVEVLSSALQTQTDTLSAVRNDAREKLLQFEKKRVEGEKLSTDLRISASECSRLRGVVASFQQQVENLSAALKAQNDAFARIQERDLGVISTLEADLSRLRDQHQSHVDQTSAELARLHAREAELDAALTREHSQRERYRVEMEWLRAIHIAMADRPFWWFLLPAQLRREREYEALRSVGLFDSSSYLAVYPDVAAQRADPLRHYITYGMHEDRDRGFG